MRPKPKFTYHIPSLSFVSGSSSLRVSILLPILFSASFPGSVLSAPAVAQPVSSSLLQQKLQVACSFLKSLYSSSLGLVKSTPDGRIYYVASDNLLAEKAISSCDRTTSHGINESINSCCDSGYDRMHEALLGVTIHVPIDNDAVYTVANST